MRTSESIKSISAALFQFQMEVVQPQKDEKADTGKYSYRYLSLQALKEHIKPLMEKHGLVFVSVGLTSRVIHTDSGEWIEGDFVCDVTGLDAQKCGAVGSYARRYNLQGLLDICAEEDDDAASALPTPQKKTAPKREQPASRPPSGVVGEGSFEPPPDTGDLRRVYARILKVSAKPGTSKAGKPYTMYGVKVDWPDEGERWVNTFSDSLGKVARELEGTEQTIVYSISQWNGKDKYDLEAFER